MIRYGAFISYSHAKDKPLAKALQSVVQTLGKPWYKRRSVRVFRDDSSLAMTPHLWPSIESALQQSRYLIFLASPESACSRWCAREVEYWLAERSVDTLLIGVTDGELVWDEAIHDFVWTTTTPLPSVLRGRFMHEPKWADMRAFRGRPNRRDAHFLDIAADFAATVQGLPQEDLLSEELAQQRRALGLALASVALLFVLAGVAVWQWTVAIENHRDAAVQRDRAVESERVALEQKRAAQAERDRAERTLAAATETVNNMVVDLAREFRGRTGVPIALVRRILDRAQALQRQLIESGEASADLKYSEAMALHELIATYSVQGDTAAALAAAERYRSIIEGLLAENPNSTLWQQVLATSFVTLGDILNMLDRGAEALDAYQQSIAIWERLVLTDQNNAEWQWGRASGYTRIGDHHADAGRNAEALEAFQKAFDIWHRLADADPDNAHWQFGLITVHNRLAKLSRAEKRYDEALNEYRTSLAIAETQKARDPTNTEWDRFMSFAHLCIGDVLIALDRKDEAIASFQKSRAMRRSLAATDPGNLDWQLDLFATDVTLGDALLDLGRREDAIEAYREALAVADRVVGDHPGNTQWQGELVVCLFKLAKAGDNPRAHLDRALRIARELATAGKLTHRQSNWISEIEQTLAALDQ